MTLPICVVLCISRQEVNHLLDARQVQLELTIDRWLTTWKEQRRRKVAARRSCGQTVSCALIKNVVFAVRWLMKREKNGSSCQYSAGQVINILVLTAWIGAYHWRETGRVLFALPLFTGSVPWLLVLFSVLLAALRLSCTIELILLWISYVTQVNFMSKITVSPANVRKVAGEVVAKRWVVP